MDWENLEALCTECHSRITARERIRASRGALALLVVGLLVALAGCYGEPCRETLRREIAAVRVVEAARCARLRAIAAEIERVRSSPGTEAEIDARIRELLAEELATRSPNWRPR